MGAHLFDGVHKGIRFVFSKVRELSNASLLFWLEFNWEFVDDLAKLAWSILQSSWSREYYLGNLTDIVESLVELLEFMLAQMKTYVQ